MEAMSVGTEEHTESRIGLAQRTDGSRVVTTSTPVTADSQLDSPEHAPARGSRRHRWPIVAAVVVVAAAVVVGVIDPVCRWPLGYSGRR